MKTLLKNAREQKGLKTREVAQMLNIDQALISKFENGQRKPTREQLSKLARLLEIDFDTLLINWLKEKIIYEIGQDEFALKAIQLAEEEIKRNSFKKSYYISDKLQQLLHEIDALKEKAIRFRQFESEKVKQLLTLAAIFNSNQLDGNTFTQEETHAVIYKGETISGKSMREHLEAINHQEAVRYLEKNHFILEKDILTLHNLIARGIYPEDVGKYRTSETSIKGSTHIPPHFGNIPQLMNDGFLWYETNKSKLHPVILATEILVLFYGVQPFLNENGKVSRLAMNFILSQHGYVFANIKDQSVLEKALEEAIVAKNKESLLLLVAQSEKESLERYLNILVHH